MSSFGEQAEVPAPRVVVKTLPFAELTSRIDQGGWIEPEWLVAALRKDAEHALPDKVIELLCERVMKGSSRPRGKPADSKLVRNRREMLVAVLYRKYLSALQGRERRCGKPAGWTRLDYIPSELAARIVAKRFLDGEASWRNVPNISSSRKIR